MKITEKWGQGILHRTEGSGRNTEEKKIRQRKEQSRRDQKVYEKLMKARVGNSFNTSLCCQKKKTAEEKHISL